MTSPIAHGYPDFGRYIATADKVLDNINDGSASGFPIHGRYFVGDVPRLGIIASMSIDNALFSVEYYSAKTGGTQMGGVAFSVRAGSKVDTTIPVVGPWVEVGLTPNGANPTYDLILFTNHSPAANQVTASTGNILASINQSVGAGVTVTVTTTRIWPGSAHWFIETALAAWNGQVSAINYSGTVTLIDSFRRGAAGDDGRQIFLPPTNCQLIVTNTTAGAGTIRAALVARPIEPGR